MSTQYETVTITIGGANPQTKTVTVPVNTSTGVGSATFSYTGTVGGTDSITGAGTIAGAPYTSNAAQVAWQTSNGQLQIGPVTAYMWNDSNHNNSIQVYPKFNPNDATGIAARGVTQGLASGTSTGLAILSKSFGYVGSAAGNSLLFDVGGAGDPTDTIWTTLSSTGGTLGTTDPFPGTQENWNMCILTTLLVPTAGNHVLNVMNKNQVLIGIGGNFGGTPFLSTSTASGGQTISAYSGYPLLPWFPYNNVRYPEPITNATINFPAPGLYPIEVDWDYWYHSGRTLQITGDGNTLTPVASLIGVPPTSTPTGNLTITPAGGQTNFQFTGNAITLTVNISGVTYPTKSYVPVWEGTLANLLLFNDPTADTFTFQTYNGQAVNKTAAATAAFALSSADNTAYQGLFTIGYNGTNFTLNYNGGTANPNISSRVLSTSLIVKSEDIAWFNNTASTFDTFVVSGTAGGNTFNFEVDYMNKPAVASFSPSTITANGGGNTLSISLTKAFSPQQQGAYNTGNSVNCTCTITGATSTGTPSAVLDSNGWLTGWNIPFTAPTATTNQTLTVTLNVSGTLTYLNQNTFVTNTVTYISGTIGTITANGTSYVAPSAAGFTLSPSSSAIPSTTTTIIATASVFTAMTNDSVACLFFSQPVGSSTKTTIGLGTQQSSSAATIGGVSGYLHTFTISFNPQTYIVASPGDYLGFTATDNVSGLTCTYTTTTAYTIASTGGGSTSPTCPSIFMMVDDVTTVEFLTVGHVLDCLSADFTTIERHEVEGYKLAIADCVRLVTENGAEIVVSATTPVPTVESLAIIEQGEKAPLYANQILPGMHLFTSVNDVLETSMVVFAEPVGVHAVGHVSVGQRNFAAGTNASHRIFTHNAAGVGK